MGYAVFGVREQNTVPVNGRFFLHLVVYMDDGRIAVYEIKSGCRYGAVNSDGHPFFSGIVNHCIIYE
jgi:hypothetical protein